MRILFLLLITVTSVSAQQSDSLSTFSNLYIFDNDNNTDSTLYILQMDNLTGAKSTINQMTLNELFDFKDAYAAIAYEVTNKKLSPYQKSPHNAVIKDKSGYVYFVYSILNETDVAFQMRCVGRIQNIHSFFITAREKPLMVFKKLSFPSSHPDMRKYGYSILGECLGLGIGECFDVKQSKLFIAYR